MGFGVFRFLNYINCEPGSFKFIHEHQSYVARTKTIKSPKLAATNNMYFPASSSFYVQFVY